MKLAIKVIPNAARTSLGPHRAGEILLRVGAPAVDGKANRAARAYLARSFGVPASRVRLISGEKSRHKKFEIVGLEAHQGRKILEDLMGRSSSERRPEGSLTRS